LQAAKAEAKGKVLQHEDSNYNLESNLFKAQGILETKSEYVKWMKQQPMKQDTDIFKYSASKEYEFPIIARRARDHLAIPATSAALECF
jgi:hAT family C-terminal dimerisation region